MSCTKITIMIAGVLIFIFSLAIAASFALGITMLTPPQVAYAFLAMVGGLAIIFLALALDGR